MRGITVLYCDYSGPLLNGYLAQQPIRRTSVESGFTDDRKPPEQLSARGDCVSRVVVLWVCEPREQKKSDVLQNDRFA
jgi:hypothetical protein